MRHNKKFNHLGRTSAHRKATLASLATALIMHKRIETTVAKAKALKMYVEPLITKSKEDTTHSRRVVFSYLKDKHAVTELFRVVAPAIGDRPGGYTRILKTGFRLGDAADMCIIELVDFNETFKAGVTASGAAKARTRRGGSKAVAQKEATDGVSDAVVVEEGAEAGATAPAKKPAAAKKAPAKKPATAAKPKAAPAPKAGKVSGSKAAAGRSVATKKG
ncbi:MAG: 50S ribosomal protein L17 [Rikenellaceae bacterium]|jgi:large subunit ribosomal protein L17|nr:50S ribosomal protein L17 [Rikenellaceae bacterium]